MLALAAALDAAGAQYTLPGMKVPVSGAPVAQDVWVWALHACMHANASQALCCIATRKCIGSPELQGHAGRRTVALWGTAVARLGTQGTASAPSLTLQCAALTHVHAVHRWTFRAWTRTVLLHMVACTVLRHEGMATRQPPYHVPLWRVAPRTRRPVPQILCVMAP